MPKRLPYEILIATGLSLCGCNLNTREREEVEYLAGEQARGAIAESTIISKLERDVDETRRKQRDIELRLARLEDRLQ